MTENEIIGAAADALTEKARFAITIPVSVPSDPKPLPKRTFWNWLIRKPVPIPVPIETERELVFYPCKVANMHRIARTALLLPSELISGDLNESVLPLLADQTHKDDMIYIIAAAIQNNHLEPDAELINFLQMNLNHEDMNLCIAKAFALLGMESFLNSIVLARGTIRVLKPETSPIDGSE